MQLYLQVNLMINGKVSGLVNQNNFVVHFVSICEITDSEGENEYLRYFECSTDEYNITVNSRDDIYVTGNKWGCYIDIFTW